MLVLAETAGVGAVIAVWVGSSGYLSVIGVVMLAVDWLLLVLFTNGRIHDCVLRGRFPGSDLIQRSESEVGSTCSLFVVNVNSVLSSQTLSTLPALLLP